MIYLYVDVETFDFHTDLEPSLPVQVAAVLSDEQRTYESFSCLVSREWPGKRPFVTERCFKVHGIADEDADRFGMAPQLVVNTLVRLARHADALVAHNAMFDESVLQHAAATLGLPRFAWSSVVCTMTISAGILKIPSTGRYSVGGWKVPNLKEAYRYFTGAELRGHHDALYDVYACRAVHRGAMRRLAEKLAEKDSLAPSENESMREA